MNTTDTNIRERARLAALEAYRILDTPPEREFDELVELAAQICETPIALVSLVDDRRQWFKAAHGLDARETPRDIAFCHYAIQQHDVMVVPDTLADARFANNPLVVGDPRIRFYGGAPLLTRDGHALGTVCAIDRVPRQLSAEQLRSLSIIAKQVVARMELRHTLRRVQETAEELEQANASKDRLFGVISHDLRTPFSAIQSLTQLLSANLDLLTPDDLRTAMMDLNKASIHAMRLVDNMLQWSLVERGTVAFHPRPIDLSLLVPDLFEALGSAARAKNLTFQSEIHVSGAIVADEQMLRSILLNLLSNAIKFSDTGDRIIVRAHADPGTVLISVQDQGVGMAADVQARLFGASPAGTTTGTAGEKGTGLGLVLCREFARRHGGELEVNSVLGEGSCFTLVLPREQAERAS